MLEIKTYTFEEVAAHNTRDDLWVVYEGKVYDITAYLDEHPGGEEVVLDCAGQDATGPFDDIGHSDDAREVLEKLLVGEVEGGAPPAKTATAQDSKPDEFPVLLIVAGLGVVAAAAYFYVATN